MRDLLQTLFGTAAKAEELQRLEAELAHVRAELEAERRSAAALLDRARADADAARADAARARADADTAWSALAAARAELDHTKAEAERSSRAKSRFLASASHDMRQPFQAMRLFLHLLEGKLTEPGQQDLARRLGEALESGAGLLNALLEISALEAAAVTPSLAEFPIGPVLTRLGEEFASTAQEKGLAIRVVPSKLAVRSDPVLLDRMLRNLISNAIRYTAKGKVLVGVRHRGAALEVQVLDQGVGIPEDRQRDIFTEFVQLAEKPKDRQGMGLGLAIVKRTGQLLDHAVAVRSRPGEGSCFSITVPVAAAPAAKPAAPPPAAPAARPAAPLLVAVAEDDRLQLAALDSMLQDWGYVTALGGNGPELLAALAAAGEAPALLITDYRLPDGLTGPALLAQARSRFGAALPGLLLTGDSHPDTLAQAADAGMTVVQKPLHPTRLRRTIDQAIAAAKASP